MDNLFAIGVGLGLRALIDTVTQHNHRVNGSLVGLWEGAVLRHFIAKYPSSLDPYIAYGFRLLVDVLWTSSWMRLMIVLLWTFMGMLLSDVGVDLAADRRFRRLMRSVRHTVIYPLLRQVSRSRSSSSSSPPRAQFFEIPASASTTSTVRSPPLQPRSPTDVSGPARTGAATPGLPRRPALRVPGSFSDRLSETDTDAAPSISRDPSITSPPEGSVTSMSRSSSSRTPSVTFSEPLVAQMQPAPRHSSRSASRPPPVVPLPGGTPLSPGVYTYTAGPPRSILSPPVLSPPPLPGPVLPPIVPEFPPERLRTPSELEYVAIPAIPDNIEQINPIRSAPRVLSDDERSAGSSVRGKDRSGLTTPTSDTERPRFGAVYSPEQVNSGLTTPERPPFGLPPVRVLDEAGHTPSVASRDLSDVNAIPIPIRVHERVAADYAEQVQASLHPELLPDINTPQPSPGLVAPAQYLPSPVDEKRPMRMPEPEPAVPSDVGTSRLSMSAPPPPYEHTPGTIPEEDVNTPVESVISNVGDRQRLLQRAESFRSIADETERRRQQLKKEWQDAKRNREWWTAFRLKHEMDRAEKETKELHAKAARRFYEAHNMNPEPQIIDVHRLKVAEAVEKVEQALYDAIVTNTPELRIITGRGNHSRGGIPAIKIAVISLMQDYHLDCETDPNNAGVLIIHPPSNPNLPSGSRS
ncbi:hypothetical protein K466DRAFT_515549 [Polyporus arcularius HHB13444]|uniref:Smr domain-containing protein n=1 Tax=Polyporus arcularius HHB13444 TaxID=1314778 RepID=A0A5C3PNL6_9APHY|nr:hypothetical protein K466DRAFT_515549 [Polyporus arcularius HHB13444]